jgi:N-acetylmuramoyl-L-alanine amidase
MYFIDMREINMLVIHCSATEEGRDFRAKDIDKWHKQQGWNEIGYHFVIDLDGKIEIGREISKIGSHCKGYNSDSIGICYVGGLRNGAAADTRTEKQKSAMEMLVRLLCCMFQIDKENIYAHHDLNIMKDCPCFDVTTWLYNIEKEHGTIMY